MIQVALPNLDDAQLLQALRQIIFRGVDGTRQPLLVDEVNQKVAIGTLTPATGNVLDVVSTTKALGIPNMTTTQKNAITGMRAGSLVFDTTLADLYMYNGTNWISAGSVGTVDNLARLMAFTAFVGQGE